MIYGQLPLSHRDGPEAFPAPVVRQVLQRNVWLKYTDRTSPQHALRIALPQPSCKHRRRNAAARCPVPNIAMGTRVLSTEAHRENMTKKNICAWGGQYALLGFTPFCTLEASLGLWTMGLWVCGLWVKVLKAFGIGLLGPLGCRRVYASKHPCGGGSACACTCCGLGNGGPPARTSQKENDL